MQIDYSANMTGDIHNAITDSVLRDRIITVECATQELFDFVRSLTVDSVRLEDGSLGAWGVTDDGNEWRMRITVG